VRAYRSDARPAPAEVFGRVVDVVDRFIDFNRSLDDQRTMAELIGCYVPASYFLPAFTVVGFLWPNGDRGSDKTQLLTVCCELGYLGQVLLAGNRRGNTVPVKELTTDKVWRTRYVNTCCPRLFSATRLPDPILASRTIVIPLIRTPIR
jgi:hypothetical protein